jgi:chemotaxis signal transduction protein
MEKALVFSVDKAKYCIDVNRVQEIIILKGDISKIPGQEEYYDGSTLVREDVVNIINAAKLLGINEEMEENTQKDFLIILNQDEDKTIRKGLRVKNVENILDVKEMEFQTLGFVENELVDKALIYKHDDETDILAVLNL